MEERRRQRNGTNRTDGTHGPQEPRIIPPHGGYHNLKSYQVAEIVFDATNALICLINQANFLLDRQLASLEQTFLNEGGFTERLYRARSQRRSHQSYPSHRSHPPND